jgi:hypothetical protein
MPLDKLTAPKKIEGLGGRHIPRLSFQVNRR